MESSFSPQKRKVGPGMTDGHQDSAPATPSDLFDTAEVGPTLRAIKELQQAGFALPDMSAMRLYRRDRIIAQLNTRKLGAILLFDPMNIRYATDSSNMQVWTLHNLARAALVCADGHMVLWDFVHCDHMTTHLSLINEVRSGGGAFYFEHGDKEADIARIFAREVKDLLRSRSIDGPLPVDRMDVSIAQGFAAENVSIHLGQPIMEHARLIKGPNEIKAMSCAMFACEQAVSAMHTELAPGLAEVELWSVLHAENIARGGEWIETRILSSGPRTNPWMQEAGPRILQEGELLAFDTDLVGLYGYCCDMSRTWLIGDGTGNAEQKEAYQVAYDHIMENMEMLAPGVSFTDLVYNGHHLPEAYQAQKYCVKMHGVGMCDEFPSIYYPDHFIEGAFDYALQPGMVLCVEAYTGKVGGREGVKLENQVLITETGYKNLTQYPYEERLLT